MRTLDSTLLETYRTMNAKHSMEKEFKAGACWNWALYGLRTTVPQPSAFFGYVDRGELRARTRKDAKAEIDANAGGVWANLQTGQPLRKELDQIRDAYDSATDNTATRNTVRDQLFDLAIRAAGFTISTSATPYLIGMIEVQDVVMWDHWWLEINGAVVETVTGENLHAYSDEYLAPAFNHPRNRVGQKGGLDQGLRGRVHSRYVTSLQDEQAGYLEILPAV
jgi:hypothetical protein